MANDTLVPVSIAELQKTTDAYSVEMNLSLHQGIDELFKSIVLNLITGQSITDQMKALFRAHDNKFQSMHYMQLYNCNEELRSSSNLPVRLAEKNNVDLNSVLRVCFFFTSQLYKGTKVYVNRSSFSDLYYFKIAKVKSFCKK